jgi:hypothetical protein
MYYILEIASSIFNIFTNKYGAIVQLYKLNSNNVQCELKEFNSGYVNGTYYVKNNKIFYTTSINNILVTNEYTDLPYELLLRTDKNCKKDGKEDYKEEKKKDKLRKNKHSSSEINVQLPPINTEITINTDDENENSDSNSEVNLDELREKIEELNRLKDKEMDDLEGLNENLHEFENEIITQKFDVDAEKNKLKHSKEKWDEFKNIFMADKKIFKIMKEQLDNNEIDEIPELFEKKFPIFTVLHNNNLLDTSSEIYEYIKLLPNDDSVYIPKNIVLKGLFNDGLVNNGISSISLTELRDNNNFETTIETDDES